MTTKFMYPAAYPVSGFSWGPDIRAIRYDVRRPSILIYLTRPNYSTMSDCVSHFLGGIQNPVDLLFLPIRRLDLTLRGRFHTVHRISILWYIVFGNLISFHIKSKAIKWFNVSVRRSFRFRLKYRPITSKNFTYRLWQRR